MRIKLDRLEPNPFRDFAVDPIDETVIAALRSSIKDFGFWGGIAVRHKPGEPGTYQIMAGETRRQAALKEGVAEADLAVGDFSDEQTIRAYAVENATQRGNTSLTVAGSVAAALRLGLREQFMALDFKSHNKRPDVAARNQENGIGEDAILAMLKDVRGVGAGALFGALLPFPGDDAARRLCDQAVAALLHSKDLVEVQRAGIIVHELDCGISRRAAAEKNALKSSP